VGKRESSALDALRVVDRKLRATGFLQLALKL
jgi:hypothetical protein